MHFNKPAARSKGLPWTIHHRGKCHIVREIRCQVPMKSEWKPDKPSNPRAFFTAMVSDLSIDKKHIAILK